MFSLITNPPNFLIHFFSFVRIKRYDEQIGQRSRPGPDVPQGQKFPETRKWEIINAQWKPEKIDYPLQGK